MTLSRAFNIVQLYVFKQYQALMRRGYRPIIEKPADPCEFAMTASDSIDWIPFEKLSETIHHSVNALFILPTTFWRCGESDHVQAVMQFAREIHHSRIGDGTKMLAGLVLMQTKPDEFQEAKQRIELLIRELQSYNGGATEIYGAVYVGYGKIHSLNIGLRIAHKAHIATTGWIDDDVHIGTGSLAALTEEFSAIASNRGAIGAQKVGKPKKIVASRILHAAKEAMRTPRTAYPHGCCMLVNTERFSSGIPARYICDDGFICFELLEPSASNPCINLHISSRATCYHYVGGSAVEIYFRVRRSLLSLAIYVADYDIKKAICYLQQIQFAGFWPIGLREPHKPLRKRFVKWLLKGVLFIWYSEVSVELCARALFAIPLKYISWSSYSWHNVEALKANVRKTEDVS